jgi:hypothetical protein
MGKTAPRNAPCRLWRKKLNRPAVSRDQDTPRRALAIFSVPGPPLGPPPLWRGFFDGGLPAAGPRLLQGFEREL